jgi:hypothetical protein
MTSHECTSDLERNNDIDRIGARIISDHISATMTYVLWSEEYLCNISVRQRVHLSDLVKSKTSITSLTAHLAFIHTRLPGRLRLVLISSQGNFG